MRVVVRLEERIDPAAARALWRLLFSEPASSPTASADDPQGNGVQSWEAKGRAEPRSA
ncbi:MAG: hypothetical protein V3V29_04000 [Acidimicrobiia bacterium]